MHFDEAVVGQLYYLNINTTYNSTILFNYRQMESAFWSEYIPTVVGVLVPLYYPPYFDVSFTPGNLDDIEIWIE